MPGCLGSRVDLDIPRKCTYFSRLRVGTSATTMDLSQHRPNSILRLSCHAHDTHSCVIPSDTGNKVWS